MASDGVSSPWSWAMTGRNSHTMESGSDFRRRREGLILMRVSGSGGRVAGGVNSLAQA